MIPDWPPLERLEEIAAWAAAVHWSRRLPYDDRWLAAWDGLTEAVATGDKEFHHAALDGISRARDAREQMHGLPGAGAKARTGRAFAKYWAGAGRLHGDPFEIVEERLALKAVWAQLPERHRRTLQARASAGLDIDRAAWLRGIAVISWRAYLMAARHRALQLWFEPETPPRVYGGGDRRYSVPYARARQRLAATRKYERKVRQRDRNGAAGRA